MKRKLHQNGRMGFVDDDGNWVIPPMYECSHPAYTGSNMKKKQHQNGRYGFVDDKGNWVIPPMFDWAGPFTYGFARVNINKKFGYIREDGSYLVPPTCEMAKSFYGDMAIVTSNGKKGYINSLGEVMIPFKFDDATNFSSFKYAIVSIDDKQGIINRDGSYIAQPIYDAVVYLHTCIAVSLNGKYGALTPSGEEILPCEYDDLRYDWFHDTLYAKQGTEWYRIEWSSK